MKRIRTHLLGKVYSLILAGCVAVSSALAAVPATVQAEKAAYVQASQEYTNLSTKTAWQVTFDQELDKSTVTTNNITITDKDGNAQSITVTYSTKKYITVKPKKPLAKKAEFTLKVDQIKDKNGNFLGKMEIKFTTGTSTSSKTVKVKFASEETGGGDQTEIDRLRKENEQLKSQIRSLEAEIERLRERIRELENGGGGGGGDRPGNPDYKLPPETQIEYKGITDVTDAQFTRAKIEDIHHYVLQFDGGHPINIYVTENYIKKYGVGFAYEEIAGMLKAVEKHRDNKPYLLNGNSFSLYFFTNENGGRNAEYPFPNDVQAYTSTNGYYGNMKTEMLLNADNNPYDFRPTLQHELVHYYDQNAKTNYGYSSYWGVGGAFFSREGAAEYGCYNYYQYPKNTKNDLPLTWPKDKKSILEYAKQQGGYRTPLLSQTDLRSFGDIYNASNNNYGVTYSLYWYLVQEYGEAKIQEYITYVNNKYEPNQSIPQEEKDSVAMKFLGKKEEQVLKEWLTYFNNFK